MNKKGRGRPLGYRLSEESKRAISESKMGQRHTEETKEKISRTLMLYFKNIHPLSKELYDDYKDLIDSDEEIKKWYESIRLSYDVTTNVLTEKSLNSKRLREISIEYNIDMSSNSNVNSFVNNPEKMCELRTLCKSKGLDFESIMDILDKYAIDICDDVPEEISDGKEKRKT